MGTTTKGFVATVPSAGRSISDDNWETIDANHIEAWKSAVALLGERKLVHRGVEIEARIDWQPLLAEKQRHLDITTRLFAAARTPKASEIAEEFSHAPIELTGKITLNAENDEGSQVHASSAIQSLFYDAFLVINIAAPGAFNLYTGKVAIDGEKYVGTVEASEFYFDVSYIDGLSGKWPSPQSLPICMVKKWFNLARDDASQVPENPAEKVLFAILHICRMDMSPMVVIWLFYAFETLFETRVGENFRVLSERIELLLEVDPVHSYPLHEPRGARSVIRG